jgi:hypothetical protein
MQNNSTANITNQEEIAIIDSNTTKQVIIYDLNEPVFPYLYVFIGKLA